MSPQLAVVVALPTPDEVRFEVLVHSDDGNKMALFNCSNERAALALRDAIREHADCLHQAGRYRS